MGSPTVFKIKILSHKDFETLYLIKGFSYGESSRTIRFDLERPSAVPCTANLISQKGIKLDMLLGSLSNTNRKSHTGSGGLTIRFNLERLNHPRKESS